MIDNLRKLKEKPEELGFIYRIDSFCENVNVYIQCECGEKLNIRSHEDYFQCVRCNTVYKLDVSVSMDYYNENGVRKAHT